MTQNLNDNVKSEETFAYAPGLKIKRMETVRKTRRLPIKGKILVKKGDVVDFNTNIAETLIPGEPIIINAAAKLGIEPDSLIDYMKKSEGDKIAKDEKICGFNAFFGLWKKWIESPIEGILENVSSASGQIVLRRNPTYLSINAYIPGTVVEVLENEGVVVETKGGLIQGILGVGGERNSEIMVVADSPKEQLTLDKITQECKGKIIVGGSIISREALYKAVELGVDGIVVGGIKDVDLEDLLGYEMGVAITGHEEVGLTLIITEGFGEMAMNPRTFELFKEFNGKVAAINGKTQIRAGVLRPEIIIPHSKEEKSEESHKLTSGMIPGTPIRVIRKPYFGALGKVVSLPVELQKLPSESKVRVVEVELENVGNVIVPRANVEIIET